jgi:YVTN family beta-propeller protein
MATAASSAAAGIQVYVANVGSGSVSVIDADSGSVVATIQLEPSSWPVSHRARSEG